MEFKGIRKTLPFIPPLTINPFIHHMHSVSTVSIDLLPRQLGLNWIPFILTDTADTHSSIIDLIYIPIKREKKRITLIKNMKKNIFKNYYCLLLFERKKGKKNIISDGNMFERNEDEIEMRDDAHDPSTAKLNKSYWRCRMKTIKYLTQHNPQAQTIMNLRRRGTHHLFHRFFFIKKWIVFFCFLRKLYKIVLN